MRSYVIDRLVWYPRNNLDNPVSFDYIINYSDTENEEPTNNTATVRLYDYNNRLVRNGVFQPQEGELMVYYSKEITSADDVEFTDDDIVWTGIYLDRQQNESPDSHFFTLTIADFGFIVYNRFWNQSYFNRELKTNEVIIDLVKNASEHPTGDGSYFIDVTNIADKRNDGSDFPITKATFINKPVYEWFKELSQPIWTNSEAEILNPVIRHPMTFKIKGYKAYWFERPTNPEYVINDNTFFLDVSEQTENEREVTYLIIECGEDFEGKPIRAYLENDLTKSTIVKERYEKIPKIAGINREYDNEAHSLRTNFSIDTNTQFRQEVRKLAQSYKEYWFSQFALGLTQITITIPYTQHWEIGEIVDFRRTGYDRGLYRIISKSNSISTNTRTTNVTLEKLPREEQ